MNDHRKVGNLHVNEHRKVVCWQSYTLEVVPNDKVIKNMQHEKHNEEGLKTKHHSGI